MDKPAIETSSSRNYEHSTEHTIIKQLSLLMLVAFHLVLTILSYKGLSIEQTSTTLEKNTNHRIINQELT